MQIGQLKLPKIVMKDKTSSSDDKEGYVEAAINESIRKVDYGDLLWVRLHGSSWWPAQVSEGKLKIFSSLLEDLWSWFVFLL